MGHVVHDKMILYIHTVVQYDSNSQEDESRGHRTATPYSPCPGSRKTFNTPSTSPEGSGVAVPCGTGKTASGGRYDERQASHRNYLSPLENETLRGVS